jgi:ribosome-binding factor A
VADQIRGELAMLLAREVRDPGVGFVTLTRVHVSADLQFARVSYTVLGDPKARASSAKALERAAPFLRRQIGARLRLRRAPDLKFVYDDSIAGQDRIEQLLSQIHADQRGTEPAAADPSVGSEGSRVTDTAERRPGASTSGSGAPQAADDDNDDA